jgi:hypothetical protein
MAPRWGMRTDESLCAITEVNTSNGNEMGGERARKSIPTTRKARRGKESGRGVVNGAVREDNVAA